MLHPEDFDLRPIREGDRELLLRWRNSDRVRSYMYTDHVISVAEHMAWFSKALDSRDKKYLIFECHGTPVGFNSFTALDAMEERCTWGFYLGESVAGNGIGSAMAFFALNYAFDVLNVAKVCSEVLSYNNASIGLHKKIGFEEDRRLTGGIVKNGKSVDIICFVQFKERWEQSRNALKKRCFVTEGE